VEAIRQEGQGTAGREAQNRSWEKEVKRVETYCQRQEKMEGTRRQPMFLMERLTLLLLLLLSSSSSLVTGFLSSLVLLLSQW
jgi:hypothetical protein